MIGLREKVSTWTTFLEIIRERNCRLVVLEIRDSEIRAVGKPARGRGFTYSEKEAASTIEQRAATMEGQILELTNAQVERKEISFSSQGQNSGGRRLSSSG